MVVLGFSSGLVVFSVVDGFLVFGLLLPGEFLGGTGGGAPGGGTFIFGSFEVGGIKWYVYLFFSYTEPVCDSLDIFGLIRIVRVGWVWSE